MPSSSLGSVHKRFFFIWTAAVVVFIVLVIWGVSILRPGERIMPAAIAPVEADAGPKVPDLPETAIPGFDAANSQWLLTVVSTEGIHQVGDALPAFQLMPPGNILVAQLIERNPTPSPVTGERAASVSMRYTLDKPYNSGQNRGVASGVLLPSTEGPFFASTPIDVMPYLEDGGFAPYPTALVEALDANGNLLAQTRVVLPVSTETGCRNCHSGPWKTDGAGGISAQTADNILAVHDRRMGTDLLQRSQDGRMPVCQACHTGQGERVSLSAAIHGFHGTMGLEGPEACGNCHASADNGRTQFYRDFHSLYGIDCTRCHGTMVQHGFALVRFEAGKGKPVAETRMKELTGIIGADSTNILPRQAHVNMPHCFGCHNLEQKPDASTAMAFNKWTETAAERYSQQFENMQKVRCISCHGSPHAVYPATSPTGDNRDNVQPLQYQQAAAPLGSDNNCSVCHTVPMDFFVHHDRPE